MACALAESVDPNMLRSVGTAFVLFCGSRALLAQVRPSEPDLSGISAREAAEIRSVCNSKLSFYGPAAYYRCVTDQLQQLQRSGGMPALSGVSQSEAAQIRSVCNSKLSFYGPAAYYKCVGDRLQDARRLRGPASSVRATEPTAVIPLSESQNGSTTAATISAPTPSATSRLEAPPLRVAARVGANGRKLRQTTPTAAAPTPTVLVALVLTPRRPTPNPQPPPGRPQPSEDANLLLYAVIIFAAAWIAVSMKVKAP